MKFVAWMAVCVIAIVLIGACNLFEDGPYRERNVSGYSPIELESPRIVLQRVLAANPTRNWNNQDDREWLVYQTELEGSLNRLAFGVSSRRIIKTRLPVPVYRADPDTHPGPGILPTIGRGIVVDNNFMPWGNLVWDSDEYDAGLFGTDAAAKTLEDTVFLHDPRKGTGRQIVLTAINETNNAGKIAGSEDGITYYFRRVPRDVNFKISADFYVDSYGFTGGRSELNGQEAFGFMARDWIPQHHNLNDGAVVGSYGGRDGITPLRPGFDGLTINFDGVETKNPEGVPKSGGAPYDLTEVGLKNIPWDGVYWNGQNTSLNDGVASSSNMIMVGGVKRGMRVYWRTDVKDPDGEKKPVTDFNSIADADFAKFNYVPREMSDYSVYGSGIDGTMRRPDFPTAGLTYKLYLEKTNSGFVARIEPPKGVGKGVTKSRVPSDGFILDYSDRELAFPDLLCGPTSVEREFYYIGLFAARDAKVTVTNLKYEESPADMCPGRIDPEPERLAPTFAVQSPTASSAEDYTLYARSNVEGKLLISVNGEAPMAFETNDDNWIVERTNASARPFVLFTVPGIKLKPGDNVFELLFMPDTRQLRSGFTEFDKDGNRKLTRDIEYLLTDTKTISRTFMVNRRSLSGADFFPLEGKPQDHYPASAFGTFDERIRREVIWVAPDGKVNGTGSYDNPLDLKTAITVSSVTADSGQVIMLKNGIYTPMDPPEVDRTTGEMRIPIRLVIPRYNSGRANTDPGAPTAPQPRPTSDEPWHPYPDPYADEYYRYYKVLKAETRDQVIIDFRKDLRTRGYAPRNFLMNGDYWIIDGIHVRNSEDTYGGLRSSGSNNLFRWVKTYFNGDSGLWISGSSDEPKSMWPTNVRIEYCESFANVDQARTNADGFAAKLTTEKDIIFYRCIAHHNVDDGWDLFAKKETGPIGAVRIEQSFAYSNGRYLNDEVGRNYSEANNPKRKSHSAEVGGNGFKMGGEGIPIPHLVIHSMTWGNDGDGVTSNSDPAILVTHVTAFDNYNRVDTNPGSNFAIYSASSPSYEGLDAIITQVLSWRTNPLGSRNDRLEPKSPASGFVWRNFVPGSAPNPVRFDDHEIYDANNGKDSAILIEFPSAINPNGVKDLELTGRSVSTLRIEPKYNQSNFRFPSRTSVRINANNTSVNDYRNNRVLTIEDFETPPHEDFAYGPMNQITRAYDAMVRRIYTSDGLSPFGFPDGMPYRRLDGTTPAEETMSGIPVGHANRSDGKIHGDFLQVYNETDLVDEYFIGLPNLKGFMKLREANFPGVVPGANRLW